MIFERIESKGLAHYSYVIGDDGDAFVIDPRRDIEVYLELTERRGYQLRNILETHRNEDFIAGSAPLAARTGAKIWHADSHLPYKYGSAVSEGQKWQLGKLSIEAISTPGHTPGSVSYVLRGSSGEPWLVFTGDTLFAGEVGRVDLKGKAYLPQAAGELYDSIYNKLLPLGDGVIVCPAHGPGSACGHAIAERPWTSIGLERSLNPRLQYRDRDDFIERVGVMLDLPPYFRRVEPRNLIGTEDVKVFPEAAALSPAEFAERIPTSFVIDTRLEGFGAAHVPGSLSIWSDGLSRYGGWFLPSDEPIAIVCDGHESGRIVTELYRMGYDQVAGYLSGGIQAWAEAGLEMATVETLKVQDLCRRLDSESGTWILDVRSQGELDSEREIPTAHHIHIKELETRIAEVPHDQRVFIFCGSGLRSMTAASLLKARGWTDLTVVLGGFAAWSSVKCPVNSRPK